MKWSIFFLGLMTSVVQAGDETCLQKLREAANEGIIHDITMGAGGLNVVIDDHVWNTIPFETKQGIVDTLNCGLLDNGSIFSAMTFRSRRTNHIIGRVKWGRLSVE